MGFLPREQQKNPEKLLLASGGARKICIRAQRKKEYPDAPTKKRYKWTHIDPHQVTRSFFLAPFNSFSIKMFKVLVSVNFYSI